MKRFNIGDVVIINHHTHSGIAKNAVGTIRTYYTNGYGVSTLVTYEEQGSTHQEIRTVYCSEEELTPAETSSPNE